MDSIKNKYFAIYHQKLFEVENYHIENNIDNCFLFKKYGSDTNPKICLYTKKDGTWSNVKELIGDYYLLIEIIDNNYDNMIFLSGFDNENILEFVNRCNKIVGKKVEQDNIKVVTGIFLEDYLESLEEYPYKRKRTNRRKK